MCRNIHSVEKRVEYLNIPGVEKGLYLDIAIQKRMYLDIPKCTARVYLKLNTERDALGYPKI